MFTFEESKFKEITDRIKDDLGEDLVERLRNEVIQLKSQYGEKLADEIEYFSDDKIVGSITFGPHIINEGLDPGTYPNFDKIREWVVEVKDKTKDIERYGTLTDRIIDKIAWDVVRKIESEGIEPTWFVDKALSKLEGENG